MIKENLKMSEKINITEDWFKAMIDHIEEPSDDEDRGEFLASLLQNPKKYLFKSSQLDQIMKPVEACLDSTQIMVYTTLKKEIIKNHQDYMETKDQNHWLPIVGGDPVQDLGRGLFPLWLGQQRTWTQETKEWILKYKDREKFVKDLFEIFETQLSQTENQSQNHQTNIRIKKRCEQEDLELGQFLFSDNENITKYPNVDRICRRQRWEKIKPALERRLLQEQNIDQKNRPAPSKKML